MEISKKLEEQVKTLIESGKTVEAVKLVQEEMKCGLKNSKNYVDSLIDQMF